MANKKAVVSKLPTKQELEEWAQKVVKSPTGKNNTDTNAQNPEKVPQKKSVTLLVFLSIITLGIYPAIWYIKRAPELNDLHTQKQLGKGLTITYLITITLTLICGILSYLFTPTFSTGMTSTTSPENITYYLSLFFTFISLILAIALAFKTRSIINVALTNKGVQKKPSTLFTLIFNMFYLQYEINRIINNKEMNKRTGPWIWFVILLLGILLSTISIFLSLSTPKTF